MTEQEFLELNIFDGIPNQNGGHDNDTMWHFSADDFKKVMERAEEYNVKILGIECWEKEDVKYTKFHEDYDRKDWHRNAYEQLMHDHSPCVFAATFEVPYIYLKEHTKD